MIKILIFSNEPEELKLYNILIMQIAMGNGSISLIFIYFISIIQALFKYLFKNITVFKSFPGIKYKPQENSRTNGVAITDIFKQQV